MSRVARHTLTLATAPTVEPVSQDEAKAWAKIDTTSDDMIVAALITAARMAAEEYLRRSLITQTWKLTLDLASSLLNNQLPDGIYDLPISVLWVPKTSSADRIDTKRAGERRLAERRRTRPGREF